MDIKDVENLANLARIELSEDEKREILSDMKGILEYVKVVEKVEADDVALEYNLKNVWREDQADDREFSRELITEQFPDAQPARPHEGAGGGRFLKVKKIL
jgi:aspartyl-tRNA(Asn)/glutamyl-tRNA(Gln) amidotransferase subunit C